MASETHKKIEAAVEVLDLTKRTVAAIDKDGISHLMKWKETGYIGEKMAKLKVSYFREFTCEIQGEDLIITAIKFLDEPQWVKDRFKNARAGTGGGRTQAPRNEKPTIYESAFKTCAELVRDTDFPGLSYEKRVEEVRKQADLIATWMIKGSGA